MSGVHRQSKISAEDLQVTIYFQLKIYGNTALKGFSIKDLLVASWEGVHYSCLVAHYSCLGAHYSCLVVHYSCLVVVCSWEVLCFPSSCLNVNKQKGSMECHG